MEFTLLTAALTGVAGVWIGLRLPGMRERLDIVDRPFDLLTGAAGVGVFSGRIYEMVANGVNPISNPFDILLVRGGVDTAVASTAAFASVVWAVRKHPVALDTLAPAAILGLGGWHGGCVWTGACLGSATGTDLGFSLPGSEVARHPTELYAAFALAILAVWLVRLQRNRNFRPFVVTGAAVAGAGAIRAATQPIRPSLSGGPMWAYLAAIVLGASIVAVGMLRGKPVTSPAG